MNDINKVFFHHDKSPSHTSKVTMAYLQKVKQELGISFINNEDIPVKTPDGSPLDFFGFGFLKQELAKRRAKTLDGIWKMCNEVWSTIDQAQIQRVFNSWKRRLRLITTKNGEHIEQTKSIHRKTIKE